MNGGEASSALTGAFNSTRTDVSSMNFETMYTEAPISSPQHENSNQSGTTLKEHDYIGLSEVSSNSSEVKHPEKACREELNLNLSATELRLGPPAALKSARNSKGDDQESTTLTGTNTKGKDCYGALDQDMDVDGNHAASTLEGSAPQEVSATENGAKMTLYANHQEQSNNVEMKSAERGKSEVREPVTPSTAGAASLAHRALGQTEPEQRPEFSAQSLLGGLQRSSILQEFRMAQAMKAAADAKHAQMMKGAAGTSNRPMQHSPQDFDAAQKSRYQAAFPSSRNMFLGVKNNGVKRGFSEAVGASHGGPSAPAREGQSEVNLGDNLAGSGSEMPDVKVKSQLGKSWIGASSPTLNSFNHNAPSWQSMNIEKSNGSLGPFSMQSVVRRSPMNNRTGEVQDASDGCGEANKHGMNEAVAPALKEPVPASAPATVGWPPVRAFVRNQNPVKPAPPPSAAASVSASASVQGKGTSSSTSSNSWFVKIYMDGVPIGRKVDLKTNNGYDKLYSALEEMFQQFINGQYCGSRSSSMGESHVMATSRKLNFLHGSEYVLIYEDHEGDFMLVGDVPWQMFINTVKRLRIMKGSEAVNIAPRSGEALKAQAVVGG